jgi:hypothetical protein
MKQIAACIATTVADVSSTHTRSSAEIVHQAYCRPSGIRPVTAVSRFDIQ